MLHAILPPRRASLDSELSGDILAYCLLACMFSHKRHQGLAHEAGVHRRARTAVLQYKLRAGGLRAGGGRGGRAWEQGGVRYLQRAASTPATRLEVVALQERLDAALQERQVPWPPRKGGLGLTSCIRRRTGLGVNAMQS